jgi:hypothetical protein
MNQNDMFHIRKQIVEYDLGFKISSSNFEDEDSKIINIKIFFQKCPAINKCDSKTKDITTPA